MDNQNIMESIQSGISEIRVEREFVCDVINDQTYTYSEFFSIARSVVEQFDKNCEELVVCKENSLELCVLLFACLIGNKTIIPVDPRKGTGEVEEILSNHKYAKVIIDKYPETYGDDFNYAVSQKQIDSLEEIFRDVDYKKRYLITYTSGTTGIAKGVVHSAENLMLSAYAFGERMRFDEKSCFAHIMPMTYMAGILNTIILPFVVRGKIILFPRFDVKTMFRFWKEFDKYSANVIWMSPTMLNMILSIDKKGKKSKYFEENPVTFCIGTAPLSDELKEKFEMVFGVRLYQSYGLTELLFVSTETATGAAVENSAGQLLRGVETQVEEDELLIKVPWCFMEYVNERNDTCFKGQFYKTGDLAELRYGRLCIISRKKDVIIRGGMKINPREIEKVIYQIFDIKECCVAPVLAAGEERICCYCTSDLTCDDENYIRSKVEEWLGPVYKVDYFIKVDEIPHNLNGKTDYSKLKELADKRLTKRDKNEFY